MTSPRWLAAPPLAGLVAVVAATAKGLYVSPDGVFYVGTARNLLDGRGLTPPPGLPPLEHFPPLFTLVLAGAGRLGIEPLTAARAVNVVAFAATVLLVGVVVRARTGSTAAGLVASVLTAAAVDLLTFSASALSEPLFVLLALAALVVLAGHLERPRPGALVAAAGLAGAALLTRYVGVAVVVAGIVALVVRGRQRRVGDAVVFAALASAPVAAWLLWAAGGGRDRTVVLHMFSWEYLGQAARPFSRWVVPWPKPPAGLVLAVLVVVAGVAVVRRAPPVPGRRPASSLHLVLAVFAVVYLAVLLANRAFTDASGRLDARFLAPLHVVAVLLVVPALHRRSLPRPAVALAGLVVAAQLADAGAWVAGGLTDDGVTRRGYSAAVWERSSVVAQVAGAGPDVAVHTNGFDAVFLLTGRATTPVPARRDYLTGRRNLAYDEELRALQDAGGLLAYFDALSFRRSFLPSRAELEATLPLEVVVRDEVGTLYRLRR